jgi:hypothetical protein
MLGSSQRVGKSTCLSVGRRDAVHFVDLTMLFKDVEETIYEDDCCHVNQRGNDLIAAKLAEAMTVPS